MRRKAIVILPGNSNLYLQPVVHDTRNEPLRVSFTDTHAMIDLADGRILGVPLRLFPLLEAASDAERQNYKLYPFSVYWEDIDDGIDITAMVSGLYLESSKESNDYIQELVAEHRSRSASPT